MSFFSRISQISALLCVAVLGASGCGFVDSAGENTPPTVSLLTTDFTVNEQTQVILVSEVTDDFENIISTRWVQESGVEVVLTAADTSTASFIAPTISDTAVLIFRVTVTDNFNTTATDSVSVTVNSVNEPPKAADDAFTLDEGAEMQVDLLVNDQDDDDVANSPLRALAVDEPRNGELLKAANGSIVGYRHNGGETLGDSFSYVANDGTFDSPAVTVNVTINPVNDLPVIESGLLLTTNEDIAGSSGLIVTDAEGDPVVISLAPSGPLNGNVVLDTINPSYVYTPGLNFNGADSFALMLDDGNPEGELATATVNITINPVNDAPVAVSGRLTTREDQDDSGTMRGSDVDVGDVLTYSIVNQPRNGTFIRVVPETGVFRYLPGPNFNGTDTFTYRATDRAGSSSNEVQFTIIVQPVNDPPVLAAPIPDRSATEAVAFNYVVSADAFQDIDGDSLTYSASLAGGGNLPGWLNFRPGPRRFLGTPGAADVGAITVRVTASDGSLSVFDDFVITVAPNQPPVLVNPIPNRTAPEDAAFDFQFAANTFDDPEGDALDYSAVLDGGGNLPGWLRFDAGARRFSGTPDNDDVGPAFAVRVTAEDAAGSRVSDLFSITVTNTNDRPVVNNPIANRTIPERIRLNFTVPANTFSDPDGDVLVYRATLANGSTSLGWVTFDPGTRVFGGTPTAADIGPVNLIVEASDPDGEIAREPFRVTVTNVNEQPELDNPIQNQSATEDATFNFVVPANTFSDPDAGDTLEWRATRAGGGGLGWLNFAPGSRTFSGTPRNADVRTLDVRVTVEDDDGLTASDTFSIAVANTNDPPTVSNTIPNQSATAGTLFTFQFAANTFSDPDVGDNLTYSDTSPGWLQFNTNTRTFSGTPPAAANIDVTVTATDDQQASVSDTFALQIAPAPPPPPPPVVPPPVTVQSFAAPAPDSCWMTGQDEAFVGMLGVDSDSGALSFSLLADGDRGSVTITDAATGEFIYEPAPTGARGGDTFTYLVENDAGFARIGTVRVIVDQHIMPLGDQVTAGVMDGNAQLPDATERSGYRVALGERLRAAGYSFAFVGGEGGDSAHEGHIGWTADELAYGSALDASGGIYAWLEANPADIVLLHAGSNDLSTSVQGVNSILDEIDRWEASANGNPVTVLLAQIIDQVPANADIPAFNSALASLVAQRVADPVVSDSIILVDQFSALDYSIDMFDSLHPNEGGYAGMAEAWFDSLDLLGLIESCGAGSPALPPPAILQ